MCRKLSYRQIAERLIVSENTARWHVKNVYRKLHVTGRGKQLVIIDTATNAQVGSVEVGERPWGLDISRDGKLVFTANGPSNDVTIVDTTTMAVVGRVQAGERPWGVVFVP